MYRESKYCIVQNDEHLLDISLSHVSGHSYQTVQESISFEIIEVLEATFNPGESRS
jgi:predicted aconitase